MDWFLSANQWTGFYLITASVMKGLRKDNAAGNFGDTILRPNCWYVTKASLQSILDN